MNDLLNMDIRALVEEKEAEGKSGREAVQSLAEDAKLIRAKDRDALAKYHIRPMLAWLYSFLLNRALVKYNEKMIEGKNEKDRLALDDMEDEPGYSAQEKRKSVERIIRNGKRREFQRGLADFLKQLSTYVMSAILIVILVGIFAYCFEEGSSTLSWDFITGNYEAETTAIYMDPADASDPQTLFTYDTTSDDEYFSSRWGVALIDTTNSDGTYDMEISYIASGSPLERLKSKSSGEYVSVALGSSITTLIGKDDEGNAVWILATADHAQASAANFDKMAYITSGYLSTGGYGIRGPVVATLYFIFFALLFSLPLGIGGAIYFSVYAKRNAINSILKSMVDMISGVPSIIFGLAGAIIFIPLFSGGGSIGNILSGSATLACMVLPTIMKNTEEAIKNIPHTLKDASLALGASQTQTVFKVILPSSVPGILTGTLLAIGRIIGESAALVFATGVVIQDEVTPTTSAASLAVYIWRIMSGEAPNYKAAAATSILILMIVFIINMSVKFLAYRLDKFKPIKAQNPMLSWLKRRFEGKEKAKEAGK